MKGISAILWMVRAVIVPFHRAGQQVTPTAVKGISFLTGRKMCRIEICKENFPICCLWQTERIPDEKIVSLNRTQTLYISFFLKKILVFMDIYWHICCNNR